MATAEREVLEGELIESESATMDRDAASQNMMQVRSSYATAVAVQRPRDINHVQRQLNREANLAGELFYYGWSVGREKISGASIGLAMAAARCWGNCAVEQLPVQETKDAWIFTAAFVDLETGFTTSRQFRQSKKSAVGGRLDAERKDDIRFQVGQSKAIRNVILNALPKWLTDNAQDAAEAGVRAKIEKFIEKEGIAAAIDVTLKALAKVGVTEAAILDKCGVAGVNGITVDHLVVLRGDLSAIQNGQERSETLFPALAPKESEKKVGRSNLNDRPQTDSTGEKIPAEDQAIDRTDLSAHQDLIDRCNAHVDECESLDDVKRGVELFKGKAIELKDIAENVRQALLTKIDEMAESRRNEIRSTRGGRQREASTGG